MAQVLSSETTTRNRTVGTSEPSPRDRCPELDSETTALLRARLRAFSLILAIGFGLFLIRGFVFGDPHLRAMNVAVVLVCGTAGLFLRPRFTFCLRRLRLVELLVFGIVVAFHLTSQYVSISRSVELQDKTLLTAAILLAVVCWFSLIVFYCMFIPNTWRRAALVVVPLTAVPLGLTRIFCWQHPIVAEVMNPELMSVVGLIMYVGSGSAIYGTHIINRLRTQTFETEARARAIYQHIPEGIIITDVNGRIATFNPAAEQLFAYRTDEVIGRDVRTLIASPDLEECGSPATASGAMKQTLESGQEVTGRRKGGVTFPMELAVLELTINNQRMMTGFARDITHRKEAEAELQRAKEAAEAANRAKSEFLANMSHEIRTPMNGIIGMTELALDTDLTPRQREFLDMVKRSADSLLALLNDILDFSKIEAGKFELEHIDFRLRDNIGETLSMLALRAHSKGLELACQIKREVPDFLIGDPVRLEQIIVNLVGNAIKFTERGEVVVRVAEDAQTEDDVYLHVTVTDTGVGIPRDKQRAIFNAFEQADSSTTRKHGGTGLGLAISSELARMMGGRIWVESEPGQGSTFHVTARFGLQKGIEPPRVAELAELEGLRVLVVDDHDTNRNILKEIVANWRMDPVMANEGDVALAALDQAEAASHPIALVISDVNMPGMNGFRLAEQIKKDPRFASLPVILLTSADRMGDVERGRALGLAAHLTKPVRQSALLEAILRIFGKSLPSQNGARTTPSKAAQARRSLRILLAEDNDINQMMAINILEKWGHRIVVANNGKETLDLLDKQPFDVVLMDLQMPEMDGVKATAAIRAKEGPHGLHIPIIAMTAHALKGDRERCLAAGMDGYVSKPIKSAELFAALEVLVPVPDELEPAMNGTVNGVASEVSSGPAFDKAALLRYVDGDMALLGKIVKRFLEKSPQMLARIEEAISRRDPKALEFNAHALKGTVGNFFAESAREAALRLEVLGREGKVAEAGPAYTQLEREVNRLRGGLTVLGKEPTP
jgi:PAS domain S-box-containing protein